jgi:hypothetical protein
MSFTPVNGSSSITASGNGVIQPASGINYCIGNIFYSGQISISKVDETTETTFFTDDSAGFIEINAILTNSNYIKVYNTGTASINISYDGFVPT